LHGNYKTRQRAKASQALNYCCNLQQAAATPATATLATLATATTADCCRCGNMAQFWLLNIIIISHLRTIFAYCSKDRPTATATAATTTATIVAAATTTPNTTTKAEKTMATIDHILVRKKETKKVDR